jgi:hypothetical protein
MNLLHEYVRVLLAEAAKTIEDLPDDVYIAIEEYGSRGARIYYSNELGDDYQRKTVDDPVVRGRIVIVDLGGREYGPCDGAWKVSSADAKKGWGPMLYDVAMEYATLNAGGLVSDRDAVSPEARRVWDYYLGNRSDVTPHQLDNEYGDLTPEIEEDDCEQRVATFDIGRTPGTKYGERIKTDVSWMKSPLSKRYTKEPTILNALRAAGRLIEQ